MAQGTKETLVLMLCELLRGADVTAECLVESYCPFYTMTGQSRVAWEWEWSLAVGTGHRVSSLVLCSVMMCFPCARGWKEWHKAFLS